MKSIVYLIGPTGISVEKLTACLNKFGSTSAVVEKIDRQVPLSDFSYVSDYDAAQLIPSSNPDSFAFGVFSVALENNWYARLLRDQKIALTTFDIEGREIEFWPTEKVIAYMVLKFFWNKKFIANGGQYERLYTTNLESSIYNFATSKDQALIGLRCLQIGPRARIVLSEAGITNRELELFEDDLSKLAPRIIQRVESRLRRNIWLSLIVSSLISFLLGIAASWIANRL
jgi:hypothetical protein